MNSAKPVLLWLGVSLGFHVAMGWSLAGPWPTAASPRSEVIQISYVETRQPSALTSRTEPKKKVRGIPIPRYPQPSEPKPAAAAPSDFQKKMEQKLKNQRSMLSRLSAEPPPNEKTRVPTSSEMLADPHKGKIFVGYFGAVKRKIQKTLVEQFAHRYSGKGSVTLMFTLNAQGRLERVVVTSKDDGADDILQNMAVQCLRESAPFGAFPAQLGSSRIAFTVTVFFDGR